MFDLIEKRNPKGKSGGTANHSDAPITALYERLPARTNWMESPTP